MNENEFDDTLTQIRRLAPGPHQPAPAAGAVRAATDFIEQVRAATADGAGPPWQTPLVEDGGQGAVVLLWQDGQRTLSLVAQPEGAVEWFYEPGTTGFGIDATQLLRRGSADPEDFARRLWPAWVAGGEAAEA